MIVFLKSREIQGMNHDEKADRFPSLAEDDPQHFDAAASPGMRRQMTAMGERGRDAKHATCAEAR